MIRLLASHIMRTTIDLDPGVLKDLKARARREHKSLGRVASELLGASLASDRPDAVPPFTWTTRPMGALVDLEDKEAIRRALDEA
jgi:plasmid stability protein